jgi:hypothetical protein
MRYSTQTDSSIASFDTKSTKDFLAEIGKTTSPEERAGSILLVGGSDFRSIAIRRAQAALRFDMRASYWSHAAILTEWPSDDPAQIKGIEATLDPASGERHEPGRNGVTAFTLARYLDEAAYPNLCVAVPVSASGTSTDWRAELLRAVANPNAGRPQYAFYAWLAEWLRYTMLPTTTPNPILGQVPLPGAALVDFAFASARINLLASATTPNAAPEHLWSTLTHWTDALASRVSLKIYRRVRDVAAGDPKPES